MGDKAKRFHEQRDAQYSNILPEEESDLRWAGDLGEIWFNDWLRRNGVPEFRWHLDNAAGKPGLHHWRNCIDEKTVKHKVPPKAGYTAQITATHKDHPIDELFPELPVRGERDYGCLTASPCRIFCPLRLTTARDQSP